MNELTPIYRVEFFLDAIVNGGENPYEPMSPVEKYLARIAGADLQIPAPISRADHYLAKICGEAVELPAPVSRIDHYLAAICGEDVEVPDPVYRIEFWLNAWASGGSGTLTTVTGVSPLALLNALAKPIRSLTQYGKCVQDGTPAPDAPVNIKCNNGALRMVDDELPSGYKRVLGFTCVNNAMWQITGFKLRGSDTVRISFSVTQACNVFGCYQGTDANDNYDLYVSTTAGSKYLRYGNGTYLSYWSSADLGERFDVVFTPTGTSGMPQDSTWTEKTFESANDMLIGSTTTTGTSSKLRGNLYGDFIVENGGVERLHLVPCERVSDNVLGYYDLIGEAFYEPYSGYDGAVSLGYDGSHYELAIVGTPETLTVSASGQPPQTVSVQNLLAIPSHADTQEIISGEVRRKIGYYVFDGTEAFSTSTAYGKSVLLQSASVKWGARKDCTPVCSHFQGVAQASSTQLEGTCFFNASGHFYFRVSDNDPAAFKTWLADLYAAGTPVILLYALATETTEQTTAHHLRTAAGTNTVTVTSEVDPVELEVEYTAAAA